MRSKLCAALAGLTLAVTLSAPAWAAEAQSRHHRFRGYSDAPGQGRSHYDREQHDDPTLF